MTDIKVGQVLWGEIEPRSFQYEKESWIIDKVGKRYAYSGKTKISLSDLRTVSNFRTYQLYLTEQEVDDIQERREILLKCRRFFEYNPKVPLPLDQLRQIHAILTKES